MRKLESKRCLWSVQLVSQQPYPEWHVQTYTKPETKGQHHEILKTDWALFRALFVVTTIFAALNIFRNRNKSTAPSSGAPMSNA